MDEKLNLDEIHEQLDLGKVIDEAIVQSICMKLMEILHQENNLLVLQSPIVVVGDIHGQYEDLTKLFEVAGGFDQKFLFMGDYVDRGYFSLNTFLLLAILKIKNPDKYYLLRGNHECRPITKSYGFFTEIIVNYGNASIWSRVMDVFDLLPLCALIDNDIFSVHGGISPSIPLISLINDLDRKRDIPSDGPISDLLWGDPEQDKSIDWKPNNRGAGFLFGQKPTIRFCHINRLRLITRSHQLAQEGYQYFFKDMTKIPEGRVLLVWSAPNYSYTSGNIASVLKLDSTKGQKDKYEIITFEENEKRLPRDHDITTSPYFA